MSKPDLTVSLGDLKLKNPIMTASGTFGYGEEYADFVNLEKIGGIVVKGISLQPRAGNRPPRVVETASGMLNAIGLENVGIDRFIDEKIPLFETYNTVVVANILGDSIEDYRELARRLSHTSISAVEVNISCPNVKKGGVAFGTDPRMAFEVTRAVKENCSKPVIIKLSPNVTDVSLIAKAAEDAGADAVSLINTLIGMAIDIKTRKPKLANVIGGLSGPAIKPVALRMVWQVAQKIKIPVIGIGGISNCDDAIEFLLAGATAIQVGTANFVNPDISEKIVLGLSNYLAENSLKGVSQLIGALEV